MEKRVQNAIDIFLDAINDGTLAKGTCIACAVGNLVAKGLDAKIVKSNNCANYFACTEENTHWSNLFVTTSSSVSGTIGQVIRRDCIDDPDVVKNISATEFTWQELAKIEYAFETNTKIHNNEYNSYKKKEIRADQINGLKAVVEVMLTFSNDTETSVSEVFTKKAELIPIK